MTHDYKRHGTTTLFAALKFYRVGSLVSAMSGIDTKSFLKFLPPTRRGVFPETFPCTGDG